MKLRLSLHADVDGCAKGQQVLRHNYYATIKFTTSHIHLEIKRFHNNTLTMTYFCSLSRQNYSHDATFGLRHFYCQHDPRWSVHWHLAQ